MFDFRRQEYAIAVKQPWELAVMRESGRRLAEVAVVMREAVQPGATTRDLDRMAEEKIRALGGTPSFLGYLVDKTPFPATICASLNDQVVHGIPNSGPLKEGDILSIDLGLAYGGYHADMAFTIGVGGIAPEARRLLDVTRESLYIGIAQARPGGRIGDIGHAIESSIRPQKLGIVRQYVGHGIGRAMHERPSVPNYGKPNTGEFIKVGMCLAIEPMITLGTWKTKTLKDDWTVVTADGSLAAHFEHTIAITPNGPEILTVLDGVSPV
jgi:methionyl aminopeptidase